MSALCRVRVALSTVALACVTLATASSAQSRSTQDSLRLPDVTLHPVVAIFYGEVDAIGEVSAPQINAAFPSAIVRVFSRSGHYPWIEAPGTFYRELNAFIARL